MLDNKSLFCMALHRKKFQAHWSVYIACLVEYGQAWPRWSFVACLDLYFGSGVLATSAARVSCPRYTDDRLTAFVLTTALILPPLYRLINQYRTQHLPSHDTGELSETNAMYNGLHMVVKWCGCVAESSDSQMTVRKTTYMSHTHVLYKHSVNRWVTV